MNLQTAAKEATWAFHVASHNLYLISNDFSGSLIRCMFDSHFHLARNKTAAIIKNDISPMIDQNVDDVLTNLHFVSLITNTSHRQNLKLLPVIARGFG